MAYKKYYPKRRYYKRRRYGAKKARPRDGFDMARTAYYGVKKLARMVNVEYKEKPLVVTASSVTDNVGAACTNFTALAAGSASTERDGISIKLARLSLRCQLDINTNATHSIVRFVIFRGKQEKTSGYTSSSVLNTSLGVPVLAPKIYDKRYSTKILYDKTFNLRQKDVTQIVWDINLKLYGHVTYDDTAASTSVENGGLYLMCFSNEATNYPRLSYNGKFTFTDN